MSKWREVSWRERPWVVYTIVRQLQPDAYGARIQSEIERQYDHDMSAGRLHILLDGFVEQGFLRCEKRPHGDSKRAFYFATVKPRPAKA